MIELNK